MRQFKNLQEAEEALLKYMPAVKEMTGKDITLERVGPLMEHVGNPQAKIKIVHVAGTSGKTSTCYYLAALLQGDGRKVGLTVSPHVDRITERLQINLKPVADEIFCEALAEFLELIEGFKPEPTWFELMIAFELWFFARQQVDYAVIETGLGGLHDASNVADAPNKVCVITDIGFDHMHILGHSLPEIAAQKAGIMHEGNRAFTYQQSSEIAEVFETYAQQHGATLTTLVQADLQMTFEAPGFADLALYQQRNWLLARQTAGYIAGRDGWQISEENVQASLRVQVPGRMEIEQVGGKTIVMDGAHNEQKMTAFLESFQSRFPGQKAAVLIAMKDNKDYTAVLPLLLPVAEALIVTTFDVIQDLPSRSVNPEEFAAAARQAGFENITTEADSTKAFELLMKSPFKLCMITGSLYLLSCVRPLIHD